MDIRLDGRSAVITGGSKGLGLAIAKEFAASGADVAILARDPATLADAKGHIQPGAKGKVAAISCDVSKMAPIKAAYDQIMSEFGKVDIFVNNAGQSTRGPSETLTDEQWQADLDLKLFAQIRFCRLLFPQMKQRRWGRIISVLNIGAKAPGADSAPTSVSRAAQMAFTKALSHEGAPHNVLVNSLHVGVIVSDQIVRRHQREGANISLEEMIAQAGRGVPMGRMGRAEEFANVACFLASDAASYVTGCVSPHRTNTAAVGTRPMIKSVGIVCLALFMLGSALAWADEKPEVALPARVATHHTIALGAHRLDYDAIAETFALIDRKGIATATIFTVSYFTAPPSGAP